jgi:DNA end-binding protein Ku
MRAIASLSLGFGLVSIPVKLYSATESAAAIRFKLMGRQGARLRQQYVTEESALEADEAPASAPAEADAEAAMPLSAPLPAPRAAPAAASRAQPAWSEPPPARPLVVEREEMVKGYEFEKGKFVLFTPAELKALQEAARQTIDIVAFVPAHAVDPVYYDKAYLLAPDKRAEKTYALLLAAMRRSSRCAIAKWAWRSRQYMVEVRPAQGGMVLQQLLYADEVRSPAVLQIEPVDIGDAELGLALRLIEQSAEDGYDPGRFVDEEKQRLLAAVEAKIAGRQIVAQSAPQAPGGHVIDLMEALRASLRQPVSRALDTPSQTSARKPARGAAKPAPARGRGHK